MVIIIHLKLIAEFEVTFTPSFSQQPRDMFWVKIWNGRQTFLF